jgi:hypothetical protein
MRRLPDWAYGRPRRLRFPLWLLKGDEVEIDGLWHRFPAIVRRFDDLDSLIGFLDRSAGRRRPVNFDRFDKPR